MHLPEISFSKKERRTVILAVTIGNLLEWYEIYLYVYWAPIISTIFFGPNSQLVNLTNTLLIFALGFLARPIGGIFFGRLGDLIGRRKSLILSLVMMTFPTFVTGLLPTFEQIGIFAPIILALMRLLQSFPAGGELPGAFCYLYESSRLPQRRYMCSWGAVGYQVGILISTIECFLLEKYLSPEDLINWGWRFSFLVGGVVGLCGIFLRYKLHETPLYKEMVTHAQIVKTPISSVIGKYKRGIGRGFLYCALNSSMFYLISINFPVYFSHILGNTYSNNLLISMVILLLITLPLPFFGRLADKFNNKYMLVFSTLGIIVLLYPLYASITHISVLYMTLTVSLISILFACSSALIPYIMADLFPTNVRFTCTGFSFNLVDATIGGFTPVLSLYLLYFTNDQGSFCWLLLFCALLSLISYLTMRTDHHHIPHSRHEA